MRSIQALRGASGPLTFGREKRRNKRVYSTLSHASAAARDGMMRVLSGLVVCLTLWFLAGLALEIRREIAKRFASWLLPPGQALTVRLAQAFARVASWIAPHRLLWASEENIHEGMPCYPRYTFCPTISTTTGASYVRACGALAEIEADLDADVQVIAPVALVAPLLWLAAEDWMCNVRTAAYIACRLVVSVAVLPMAAALAAAFAVCLAVSFCVRRSVSWLAHPACVHELLGVVRVIRRVPEEARLGMLVWTQICDVLLCFLVIGVAETLFCRPARMAMNAYTSLLH